jgi:gallate dioxygenase
VAENLAGLERLPGTYPFDLARSVQAYALNAFLHGLIDPQRRAAFLADEDTVLEATDLREEERQAIRRRDWPALLNLGAIFFMLEKLAAVSGVSNLHVYAAMRHQTLEAFQKTRNTKANYSVAAAKS